VQAGGILRLLAIEAHFAALVIFQRVQTQ